MSCVKDFVFYRYQAMDSVSRWGDGPGVGQRMTPDAVRMQQEVIIEGKPGSSRRRISPWPRSLAHLLMILRTVASSDTTIVGETSDKRPVVREPLSEIAVEPLIQESHLHNYILSIHSVL